MTKNEALQKIKKLNSLFFKDIDELKSYIKSNFEEVEFNEILPEEDDECDFYNLLFASKYHDFILYYLKTRNNHVLLVDALPFLNNK